MARIVTATEGAGTEGTGTGPVREVTAEEVAFFRDNGWVLLEGFIDRDLATDLAGRANRLLSQGEDHSSYQTGAGEQFNRVLQAYLYPSRDDDAFASVGRSPTIGRAASQLLRDVPVRYYFDELLAKPPAADGGVGTAWHQDYPYSSRDRSGQVQFWIALVDIPPESSSLRFLSGSHRAGVLGRTLDRPDDDLVHQYPYLVDEHPESPPLSHRPGDAVAIHSLVVHGAEPNRGSGPRLAYTVNLFQADALYTGTPQRTSDSLEGLTVNRVFDHPGTPVLWPPDDHQ